MMRPPSGKEFLTWFKEEFNRISGKWIVPTVQELEELANEIYKKLT